MKISLIMPVAKFYSSDASSVPPYALLFIGSALKKSGHDVRIFHDSDFKKVIAGVLASNPEVVGISAFTGYPVKLACDYAKEIKKVRPDIKIILGGYHASMLPEQVLKDPWFDFVAVGEGEETIVELADAIKREEHKFGDIKGLGWKLDDIIFVNEKRELPSNIDYDIDWDLMDIRKYTKKVSHLGGKRYFYIFSSRGCPYSCSFCAGSYLHKQIYRKESADHVIKQYKPMLGNNNVELVEYLDDNFFVDLEWAEKVAKGIGRPYRALIRIDRISPEVCKLLNETRCRAIFVGIESGSQYVRNDIMGKGLTDEKIYDAVEMMSKLCPDINISAMFIAGIPGEEYDEFRDTCRMAIKLTNINERLLPQLNTYAPYPYCKSYEDAVAAGWDPPTRTEDWILDSKPGSDLEPMWLKYYGKRTKAKFDRTAQMFILLRRLNQLDGWKFLAKELLRIIAIIRLVTDFYWFPVELDLFWLFYKRQIAGDII